MRAVAQRLGWREEDGPGRIADVRRVRHADRRDRRDIDAIEPDIDLRLIDLASVLKGAWLVVVDLDEHPGRRVADHAALRRELAAERRRRDVVAVPDRDLLRERERGEAGAREQEACQHAFRMASGEVPADIESGWRERGHRRRRRALRRERRHPDLVDGQREVEQPTGRGHIEPGCVNPIAARGRERERGLFRIVRRRRDGPDRVVRDRVDAVAVDIVEDADIDVVRAAVEEQRPRGYDCPGRDYGLNFVRRAEQVNDKRATDVVILVHRLSVEVVHHDFRHGRSQSVLERHLRGDRDWG